MKLLLITALCFFSIVSYSADYYFSSTSGDDSRSNTQAQNPSTPWSSLSKFNSIFAGLNPGDNIYFKRGDTFYGSINISRNGAAGNPITIGAYGTGAKPIITGFTDVTSWTNIGGNIWESTSGVSSLNTLNVVAINNKNTAMGKTPNSGYYEVNNHVGSTSLTSSSLSGSPNYSGGIVVSKKERFIIDRQNIILQVGNTITAGGGSSYPFKNNWGFFIMGHPSTLDVQNEWYYNTSSKKIQVYSTSSPTNVKVASIQNLITISSKSYISFVNLELSGANNAIFDMVAAPRITVSSCDLKYATNGLLCDNAGAGNNSYYFNFNGNTVTDMNNNGIYFRAESDNSTYTNNTFRRCGLFPGMGDNGDAMQSGVYFSEGEDNCVFQYNRMDSIGNMGVNFVGLNWLVDKNYITNFCLERDDAGGIYTGVNVDYTGTVISNNIVLYGPGSYAGTENTSFESFGIYLDSYTRNLSVINNTVGYVGASGFFVHKTTNMTARGNTFYKNGATLRGNQMTIRDEDLISSAGLDIKRNVLFSDSTVAYTLDFAGDITDPVLLDSNYYWRPKDENEHIQKSVYYAFDPQTFAEWKSYSGQDANTSGAVPGYVTTTNDSLFYNPTNATVNISTARQWRDVYNNLSDGTITLTAYQGKLLFDVGAASGGGNQAPTANAGLNQNITLPANSLTLNGSGNDPDGTITAYQWTKIAGPAPYTIVSPAQATTVINGLTQGVYEFELRVTDNAGASARDTVIVTVNAAVINQPPTANAGLNQNITLPANSLTLNGSGNDPDGTITAYQWTKIAGPAPYTIVSPAQATTVINGLTQGVYEFELRVTDNAGASARDTVIVTVNAAVTNQPPTANAGLNQNITLPANSLTLNGSGNDPDGTITAYQWTKIAGPASFILVSPAQAVTLINGLTQGVYEFELRVTDNAGASARDTVIVTVNAAVINQPPTANAGLNQNITLPANSLTLNGSGNDPDGTITAYQWTKIAGPASFTIVSPAQATTLINGLTQGVYQFELRVTDNAGAFGRDTVIVTVNAAANQPPTANAGLNQNITLPANSLTLNGSGNDPDGTITAYQWTKISGPASFTIVSPAQAVTVINGLIQGVYQFELRVTDNAGASGRDTVIVTVNATANQSPTANAGNRLVITLPVNSVTLIGSGTDPDGIITAYQWTKISGPASYSIVSPSQAATIINNLTQGMYEFELRVTDNGGASGRDIVIVTVNPAVNQLPTADAGNSIIINLPVNTVTLNGTGSDPDGSIIGYNWTKIAGPSQFDIILPNSAETIVKDLVEGTYLFQLKATDNNGAIATDTVEVIAKKVIIANASIFPNPVSDVMNLKIEAATIGSALITIYDMAGKTLYEESFLMNQNLLIKQINVSGFRKGAYIIKIIQDKNMTTIKMIKQ